ncbi:homeobox protein NANOG [Corythoichthys intestinalis]|uniref:homeobox protein NANOG n=1 Tax=Corythoichthys intestinalis TaxID=161448 RepID=UPI0025A4D1AE|nr:homeobox protein NANOG [Corythoichthys intestinalis]XP_061810192.1 homeobox protein Nkx-2.2a-like [Nerophis lumbriciformis]
MAEWKTQINYDYNPSYHAFAYGLVYQSGHEQNCHVAGWGETAAPEYNNYAPGMTQVYYAATASRTREASLPHSPEQHVANAHCRYQGSGLVYVEESQAGHLVLAGTPRATYDSPAETSRRTGGGGSDSTSDSEAHASPDSWSFSSGRENSLPQVDPALWVKPEQSDDANSSGPEAGDHVSSSLMVELSSYTDASGQNADAAVSLQAPLPADKKPSTNLNGKGRVSFSEDQMNFLVQRFSVQRYLTPAEMKNVAEMTGLTYKQVKTWFQNRRMKLRRHQKDNNWVSERYNKSRTQASSVSGSVISHVPRYQVMAQRPAFTERYNHPMMDTAFKKTTLQNLAFYLASMGNTAGSTPFPTWSSGMPARPQAGSVSAPPGINQYEYNSSVFHSTGPDGSFEDRNAVSVINQNPSVIVHDISQ